MTKVDSNKKGSMRIALFVDPAMVWQWHIWFSNRLKQDGHHVDLCVNGKAAKLPATLRLLLQLEQLLYRGSGENASDLITIEHFKNIELMEQPARADYDLMIDLAGETELSTIQVRQLRPLYDGLVGANDLIGGLLDGKAPHLSLDDNACSEPRPFGQSAIEQPDILFRGLNNVFSRMMSFLLKSVNDIADNPASPVLYNLRPELNGQTPRTIALKAGRFVASNLSTKIGNRLNQLVRKNQKNEIRWGVGWRFTAGHSVRETNSLSISNYTRLKDDGQRFFADPFVVFHQGNYHVFVEEFPFATQTGVISHFTINQQGESSPPQVVLSRPYHLSYPFIFKKDEQFWMIPETSGNRAVELYRAERFPDKWVLEKTLIGDIKLDDVTLIHHEEHWWLFAAVSDWQSSQWDTLGLFYADDLFGNWHPHQGNPVMLDATAARPAGAMYLKEGALWRPAQDCSTGYGAGLSLCRVDRLDPLHFEQSVLYRFAPSAKDRLMGLHTLNEHQGLEVIDFYGRL